MDTGTEITSTENRTTQVEPSSETGRAEKKSLVERLLAGWEGLIIFGLALTALIPRVILATQLDMVTDEGTYIVGGKVDLPLVAHLRLVSVQWDFNYEHPPLVKLLIGLSIFFNAHLGHLFSELFAARLPSIISGTLLVLAIYWLGRAPFGRAVALLAALCLAVSPWLVYFSALAYLDMTMTTLITVAYLLLWPAIRRPQLYVLAAICASLGFASKYTAALIVPGMVVFTAYYFLALRPKLPPEHRPEIPWQWWLIALLVSPAVFLAADPAIWKSPASLLIRSFTFEWDHSVNGHLTFIAGQIDLHVHHWTVLYIIFAKMSMFVTIPAACFAIFALVQLLRFHLGYTNLQVSEVASIAMLLIWLVALIGMLGLLNIVVGTHYYLPIPPAVALAGASAWVTLFRYRRGALLRSATTTTAATPPAVSADRPHLAIHPRAALILALLTVILVGPHLFGLTTVYAAEGYSSEAFNGENSVLQVAYPAYREGALWLLAHTHTRARVGLVAILGTILGTQAPDAPTISWYTYNKDLMGRLTYIEAHPDDHSFPYDYLIWPMHLVQRGYAIPQPWRSHIVHVITGGSTTYCFILARDPATIS